MSFETHLTLNASQRALLEAARQFAHDHSLKWTHIELQNGVTPSQPMITFWGQDSLDSQLQRANAIKQSLEKLKIEVVRIKVETEFPGPFVPTAGCTQPEHENHYFECHIKLHLNSIAELDRLRSVASPHGAHVSRNAIKTLENAQSERFVTLRSHHCAGATAQTNQLELASSLRQNGFDILEIESEFVLVDSNFALDAGWN